VEGSCNVYSKILIEVEQYVVGRSGESHDHSKGNMSSAENRTLDFRHTKHEGNPFKCDLQLLSSLVKYVAFGTLGKNQFASEAGHYPYSLFPDLQESERESDD
jgi:hypothetical protein